MQRELRGIAFLAGTSDAGEGSIAAGRERPADAAAWRDLVGSISSATFKAATSLRRLQAVLDSFPPDADMTNVLKATPQHHPHRDTIMQLGMNAGNAAGILRDLLTLADLSDLNLSSC